MNLVPNKISKYVNYEFILFMLISCIPLLVISQLSDLPTSLGNWASKTHEILDLKVPSSNFYPAGSAIMLAPFIWNGPNFFIAILFYYLGGSFFYWKICSHIKSKKIRYLSLAALPMNPYLIWLCYSSQDTVFEFFLLTVTTYYSLKYRPFPFIISGFVLCLTRPSYWILYIALGIFLQLTNKATPKLKYAFLLPLIILPINISYNMLNYKTSSIANEAGLTAYYSYNKYYYLAHPKFDMDVFLSNKGHMSIDSSSELNESELNKLYVNKALKSIKDNPKETLLGTIQKLDSYIFDIQKIPHLPGEYYLSADAKSIVVGDQRLDWKFVMGNLLYALERMLLLIFLIPALFITLIGFRKKYFTKKDINLIVLAFPWVLGVVPGVIFYTETRFKIVSELFLVPFIALILTNVEFKQRIAEKPGIFVSYENKA
jgi:hypothetical protein